MNYDFELYKKTIDLDIIAVKNSNINIEIKKHIIEILNNSIAMVNKKNIISDDLESLSNKMTSGNVSHCQGTLRTIAYSIKTIL
jgi:hypothetical protein